MKEANIQPRQLQFGRKLFKDSRGRWSLITTDEGPMKADVQDAQDSSADDNDMVRDTALLALLHSSDDTFDSSTIDYSERCHSAKDAV